MIKDKTIKIGTRGSKLAMWQAKEVKSAVLEAFPHLNVEIIIIKTEGDKKLDIALSKVGDKGFFTKEIEENLCSGEINLAVHSLKDMPTELPEGLIIGGMLPRADVRDVFLSKDGRKLSEINPNDKVATSSLRRRAQLLHFNSELNVIDIRGNVDTRIQKMKDGYCDGQVLAAAGIIRLGLSHLITEYLEPEIFLPAVGQGAVAIEIREDDEHIATVIDQISDDYTRLTTLAERALLRTLEGGCQVPVACYTEKRDNRIKLTGRVSSLDGKKMITKATETNLEDASEQAIVLAQSILDEGGQEILDAIRKN